MARSIHPRLSRRRLLTVGSRLALKRALSAIAGYETKNFKEAFQQLIALGLPKSQAYNYAGGAYLKGGNYAKARECFRLGGVPEEEIEKLVKRQLLSDLRKRSR